MPYVFSAALLGFVFSRGKRGLILLTDLPIELADAECVAAFRRQRTRQNV